MLDQTLTFYQINIGTTFAQTIYTTAFATSSGTAVEAYRELTDAQRIAGIHMMMIAISVLMGGPEPPSTPRAEDVVRIFSGAAPMGPEVMALHIQWTIRTFAAIRSITDQTLRRR